MITTWRPGEIVAGHIPFNLSLLYKGIECGLKVWGVVEI